jgi:hypothetical protein
MTHKQNISWRMPSSGIWRHVALVRIRVSEKHIASIIRVKRIGEEGMLALTSAVNVVPSLLIVSTLMMESLRSSQMSVLTRTMQHHSPEDGILLSHHCENLKFYTIHFILNTRSKVLQKLVMIYFTSYGYITYTLPYSEQPATRLLHKLDKSKPHYHSLFI